MTPTEKYIEKLEYFNEYLLKYLVEYDKSSIRITNFRREISALKAKIEDDKPGMNKPSDAEIWEQINGVSYNVDGEISNWAAFQQQRLFEWIKFAIMNDKPVMKDNNLCKCMNPQKHIISNFCFKCGKHTY